MAKLLNKKLIPIALVLCIALFARMYKLSNYPVHLSMDEVSIGYNAYSILTTGRDEWGKFMPLSFESVGDYKPPVDVYLDVPSVALFGLNEWAVRFPIALLGSLSVIFLFGILRKVGFSYMVSILTGLWLALLGWHIHFSRATFGAIPGLFFFLVGLFFFLDSLETKKSTYQPIISAAGFGLSVWAYHAERLFIPIFVIVLACLFKKEILGRPKDTKRFIITTAVFAIPFLYLSIFTPAIRSRAQATSIFREPAISNALSEKYTSVGDFVFDNKLYIVGRHWFGKYLNYFDARFWFRKGLYLTPPGYPDIGLLGYADILLVAFGFIELAKSNKKVKTMTFALMILGPLPASFTMNEQHPLRALTWLPFFCFIIALGLKYLFDRFKKYKTVLAGVLVLMFVIDFSYFANIYVYHFPRYFSQAWQYGYKEIALYACANKDNYDQIFISESFGSVEYFTSVPQLYLAFYCKTKPISHISDDPKNGIFIKRPSWKFDKDHYTNTLFIAAPWDFPIEEVDENQIIKKIYFLDESLGFIFVKI